MTIRTSADKTSIFVGVAFILLASIIGTGGFLWKTFVEYTSNSSNLPDVFSGISAQAPYNSANDPDNRDEVVFSFTVPRGDLVKFLELMQPTLDEIVEKTGKAAKIDISTSEYELINKVEGRLVDFGSIDIMSYLAARKEKKIKAILERFSDPPKRTLFVVKADSPARTMADIKGYRIAYRGNDSLSGYQIPLKELAKLGYDHASFFKQEYYSENYSDSILGLQNDQYDCIILSSNFFLEQAESTRKSMRIIHESHEMPGGVYITSSKDRNPYEQIIVGNFMKKSGQQQNSEMFSGMFKTRRPNEQTYDMLEQEYLNGQ
ncbi:MAG: phosphate/phosphite/phosphonate ABC transporter substrate-binding protein [Candidatus Riflebacteria bacterium]|nr:phosphate/phosphite/phosphonate ABC transporter substrate-binding protein [Candidatus Riflebacteria bacterium]